MKIPSIESPLANDARAISRTRSSACKVFQLLIAVVGLGSSVLAQPVKSEAFDAASKTRVHVEALSPRILRVWIARNGADQREPSLATDQAPQTRSPLKIERSSGHVTVDTGELWLNFDPARLAFSVSERAGGAALLADVAIAIPSDQPAWTLTASLAAGEEVMGLGQDNHNNGRLDRRGVVRDLWAGQQINSGNVTAQYPVPFHINVLPDGRAFGIFYDNIHHLNFDIGKSRPDQFRLAADGGEIDLYIIAGPKIADVIDRYTSITGRPSLPPLWALGYWQSKCTYYDWRPLDEAYEQLHTRGFPVDVMVIDYDWPEVFNDFQWAKRWFADGKTPADRIGEYAKRGVKIVTSQSGPMIRQESPTFASGWSAGVFATDGHGNPVECGHYGGKLLDFTSPKIDEWLWPQIRARIHDGVAGWWLDLTEPEGEPPQTVYHGGTPANVHNEYSLLSTISFEGAQLAENPDRRPWILTRAGSAGMQRHHAAVWTGDIYSDYATLRAHPAEMLNSGLSGFTWWTCDSGGFMNGYYRNDQMGAHARLYERWMQFSVFAPITRAHKAGGVPEPYQFGPAVEQSCREYLKLRYRLLPFIYSYAWMANQTGMPIVRPLALEFQTDARSRTTPGDQYLFGHEMLVAPVLFEGVSNRQVYFPPGRWFDWDTGVEYAGGRDWVVAAPQNHIPVAVRAGAIIPLAPDMLWSGERPWDPLTVEVYPSGRSEFTLYRDDGVSFAYQKNESTVTKISCDESDSQVQLSIDESNKRFTPATYVVRMHLDRRPLSVKGESGDLPFEWDAEARVLRCAQTAGAGLKHTLAVALDSQRLAPRPAPELHLDVPNTKAEASSSVGVSSPHFYPAPALPARVKAINYDNGGEGVAFHSTRPLPEKKNYRPDDFSIASTADAGGGFVLAGLRPSEWARYTINCGGGGYFDLSVRVASASGGGRIRFMELDHVVAVVDVPKTGGDDQFVDVEIPAVYVNPGERSLMVYVDSPGFSLNTFSLRPSANPSPVYAAALGLREGFCEVISPGKGSAGHGLLDKLGKIGSALTLGINAPANGPGVLRIRYSNTRDKPIAVSMAVGAGETRRLDLAPNLPGNEWSTLDVPVELHVGGNAVVLRGLQENWDSVTVDSIERVVTK